MVAQACGPADLAACRARAAQGPGPVCTRARPVTAAAMAAVVGTVDGLAGLVEGWSAQTWQLLVLVAPEDDERRAAVRRRALECAHLAGRGAVVAYGRAAVQSRMPALLAGAGDPVPPAALLLQDAVLGAITADLLGHGDRHVLSRPLLDVLGS